jgi:predicted dehydrogenase
VTTSSLADETSRLAALPRAGVIGARGIGRVHVDAVRRIGIEVAAVAATSPERARRVADELRVHDACASAEELVSRPDIDVVHVCTPPGTRAPLARAALRAGKHVISEKPLAINAEEAAMLAEEARRIGVVHAVTYNYRFYPMLRALREAVRAGRLGTVHLIHGAYLLDELLRLGESDHWLLDPESVGPALVLADVGLHWWDMLEYVTGDRITDVSCSAQIVRPRGGRGEDSAALMLRTAGGARAVAAISNVAAGYGNTIDFGVIGTKASALWRQQDPEHLWIAPLGQPAEMHVRSQHPAGVLMPDTLQLPAEQPQGFLDAFRDFMSAVYSAVADRNHRPALDYPTFADGLRGVRILEAVAASINRNEWVPVG